MSEHCEHARERELGEGEVLGCAALCDGAARRRRWGGVMVWALLFGCTSGMETDAELDSTDRALSIGGTDGGGLEPHHPHPRGARPPRGGGRSTCGEPLGFSRVAQSSAELDIAAARPALNAAGDIVFAATDASGAARLMVSRRRSSRAIDVSAFGLGTPVQVAIDDARNVAFLAPNAEAMAPFGVFTVQPNGQSLITHYAAVEGGNIDAGIIDTEDALALSPNGVLTFSSIRRLGTVSGPNTGALYRGTSTGGATVVVRASDVSRPFQFGFGEARGLDINADGTIAADMVHVTRCGIQNGVLVFDTPEPEFAAVPHVLTGVTSLLSAAIDDVGNVVFALRTTQPEVAMTRCPPAGNFDFSFLANAIYRATPRVLSEAPDLTPLVETTGPFAAFGAVETSPAGQLVFEGELDDGRRGIFLGAAVEQDAVVLVGDELGGEPVEDVQLGELNNACEMTLATTSASGRSVWRVTGVAPRPL